MNIIPAPKDNDVQLSLTYDEEMHCLYPKKYARLLINGIPVLLLKDGHFTVCEVTEKQAIALKICGIEISKFSKIKRWIGDDAVAENPVMEDRYCVRTYDPSVTHPK